MCECIEVLRRRSQIFSHPRLQQRKRHNDQKLEKQLLHQIEAILKLHKWKIILNNKLDLQIEACAARPEGDGE